tara:strand:- start:136 stop:1113 length:978 start_codon:yes stop_codon:yes gene_type:complete
MIFFKKLFWAISIRCLGVLDGNRMRVLLYRGSLNTAPLSITSEPKQIYVKAQISPFVGIGHKLGNLLAAYAIAKDYALSGVVFSSLQHEDWPKLSIEDSLVGGIRISDLPKGFKKVKIPRFNFNLESDVKFFKSCIENAPCMSVIVLEKDQFYEDISISSPFLKRLFVLNRVEPNDDIIQIGVHIRRGDILKSTKFAKRVLDFDYYNNTLYAIVRALQNLGTRNYRVVLFSNDYVGLDELGFDWQKDESVSSFDSFYNMARCNVLVTSLSSFSYKPALICENLVFYPMGFWHSYPSHDRYQKLTYDYEYNSIKVNNAIQYFFRKI